MKSILATVAIIGFTVPAFAHAADFSAVDSDQSGALSWEEVATALPDTSEDAFKAANTDGSGDLSAEEYAAVTVQYG